MAYAGKGLIHLPNSGECVESAFQLKQDAALCKATQCGPRCVVTFILEIEPYRRIVEVWLAGECLQEPFEFH